MPHPLQNSKLPPVIKLRIGQVAYMLGVSNDTVRHLVERGALYAERGALNGYHYFRLEDVRRYCSKLRRQLAKDAKADRGGMTRTKRPA